MANEVYAPLAGKIVKVSVEVGQQVEEDDEAMVIEAMKMETPVYLEFSGTVKEIRVKEGQQVEEEDVLAIVE